MFRTPALICFSGPNDVCVPGLAPGRPRGGRLCFCSYAKGSRNRRKGSADEIAAVPVYVGF
jgi:hypothetical protein